MPESLPVRVLSLTQKLPQFAAIRGDLIRLDPNDWEYQIVPPEIAFSIDEPVDFPHAFLAAEEARREDGDEEGHRIERFVDSALPVVPPSEIGSIPKDVECLSELQADLPIQMLNEPCNAALMIVRVRVTEKRRWFRLFRAGHPNPEGYQRLNQPRWIWTPMIFWNRTKKPASEMRPALTAQSTYNKFSKRPGGWAL